MCKLFILGLLLSVGVVNCQSKAGKSKASTTPPRATTTPSPPPTYVGGGDEYSTVFNTKPEYDTFEWNLFSKLLLRQSSNVLISPLSIKYALSMLYEASAGHTEAELQALLGAANKSLNTAAITSFRDFIKTPPSMEYTLEFGSKLYVDESINVKQRYGGILENDYKSKIEKIDVRRPNITVASANKWVEELTRGNIKSIVTEDDLQNTVILLLNTIYFNGSWETPFQKNDTKLGQFHLTGTQEINTPMMTQRERYLYYDSDILEAKLLKLPYKGEKLSMVIILPNSIDGLQELVKNLRAGLLNKEISKMKSENVIVTIPKFKFEYESHLVPILKDMGLKDVFENTASLPNLASGQSLALKLSVNDVLQKSGIEINEVGTEAYTATALSLVNKFGDDDEDPVEFTADRPFLYFIQNDVGDYPSDKTLTEMLFIGTVSDPIKARGILNQVSLTSQPEDNVNESSNHQNQGSEVRIPYSKENRMLSMRPTGYKYGPPQ